MRRPASIRYGLEDRPPWPVVAMTALQQATVVFLFLYVPQNVAREAQATLAQTVTLISMSFLACGLGTMLQAVTRSGLGSGFLAPLSPSTPVLAPAVLAVVSEKTGYPVEMLNLDMGLDSDLGIDSIKRVEIMAAV
jgi:NCS2 family nucleobase:cation symporter-2